MVWGSGRKMKDLTNTTGVHAGSGSLKTSLSSLIPRGKKKLLLFLGALVAIVVVVMIPVSLFNGGKPTRTESYKEVSGAAGLNAAISYDCGKQPCSYDFNVYILREDGQQVNVVRPDKDGNVNLALAEGNYVMLIGKLFGNDKIFPQEPVSLKNGKALDLKLDYK